MDPTLEGALIGAGSAVFGGVLAWFGARSQARAALRAVELQVLGQRFDALWQVRRGAYASFVTAVEIARMALAQVEASYYSHEAHMSSTSFDVVNDATDELLGVRKNLWHEASLLRLSVDVSESANAEGLVSLVDGVAKDQSRWIEAAIASDPDTAERLDAYRRHMAMLGTSVEHFMNSARDLLEFTPGLERPREGLLQRFRTWRLARRIASAP